MAGLLVSVRSASEAIAALSGGASVIDVKEPSRGPLGRADPAVWREVVEAVGGRAPVSAALGELAEGPRWISDAPACTGLSFRKLGLAGEAARPDWSGRWASMRSALGPEPSWVSVVYADWRSAQAPEPELVLEEALRAGCSGLLIDTFDKTRPSPLDTSKRWLALSARARSAGLFLALAGRLDAGSMARLAPLKPSLFAVRGSACRDGDRLGAVDPERVAGLVEMVRSIS
jgi:uncharacterized protein (UPF0264 family)